MVAYQLDEVFNEAQIPTLTYVPPAEAKQLRASLKTKGKHVTLVGASGSGKSTVAEKILAEVFPDPNRVHKFSGRTYTTETSIVSILGKEFQEEPSAAAVEPWLQAFDLVVIDDVHHLSFEARQELARMLKLWHEKGIKFLLIGIAKTSDQILGSDPELAIRNDVHTLAAQDAEFLRTVLLKGEAALNIEFDDSFEAAAVGAAKGLPAIFQAMCRIACVECDVEHTESARKEVKTELSAIGRSVVRMFDPKYFLRLVGLAQGRRQARAVHDTFFEIVDALGRSSKTQISKPELYQKIVGSVQDPELKKRKSTSFYRAMDSLQKTIEERKLDDILIFESDTLSIDDPLFRFYLDHVDFDRIRSLVKIRKDEYEYDVAVSFAGEDRTQVSLLVSALEARGVEVFYDFNESARLWGKDLENELARIYAQEARFMVLCLSKAYPVKDWTRFELDIGGRAAKKRPSEYLLPLRLSADLDPIVGLKNTIGYQTMSTQGDVDRIAELLLAKATRWDADAGHPSGSSNLLN
jgi:energy-coupling factor transporter ATP-binding protein EcfA2